MGFRAGLLACLCVALCAAKESVEVSASGKIYAATAMKKGTSEVLCGRQQVPQRALLGPWCPRATGSFNSTTEPRNRAVPSRMSRSPQP